VTQVHKWRPVWERKGREVRDGSTNLAELLRANGYDTGHGDIAVEAWTAYAEHVLEALGAESGHCIYEVGCGAGAFLLPIRQRGLMVAGCDYSSTLVAAASKALPDGEFECCEARDVRATPQYDFVVANSVFFYFADLDYAEAVIRTMASKARRGIAILDNPDLTHREETLALRYQVAGGKAEYEKRYDGLDHLYFDRDWFAQQLRAAGATSVAISDQQIRGYGNAAGRFNVFAHLS
jgi:2-polyprenyl-3-methyl-5-hydroxy-6-metoxy-1,4-benzoquinol methylase